MKMKTWICETCGKEFQNDKEICFHPVCPECLDAFEMPDALPEAYGFPKLTGSRKQVEWAITIRTKAFGKYQKRQNKKHTIDDFKTQASAAWWIENR
jgi:hypothetical protein